MADATAANQKAILKNQAAILANQKAILANQKKLDRILANQKTITANQAKILANQKKILGAARRSTARSALRHGRRRVESAGRSLRLPLASRPWLASSAPSLLVAVWARRRLAAACSRSRSSRIRSRWRAAWRSSCASGRLVNDAIASLFRVSLPGSCWPCALGVPAGLLLGRSRWARAGVPAPRELLPQPLAAGLDPVRDPLARHRRPARDLPDLHGRVLSRGALDQRGGGQHPERLLPRGARPRHRGRRAAARGHAARDRAAGDHHAARDRRASRGWWWWRPR